MSLSASANVMSRMSNIGGERRIVVLATAASRLSRAFHDALETYYRLKRGNTQVIRVEKIEVQLGADAFVGNLRQASLMNDLLRRLVAGVQLRKDLTGDLETYRPIVHQFQQAYQPLRAYR